MRIVAPSRLQARQKARGRRWMPRATTRRQDASVIQLSGDCADADDALGAQVFAPSRLETIAAFARIKSGHTAPVFNETRLYYWWYIFFVQK